jgi:hypothetical protein
MRASTDWLPSIQSLAAIPYKRQDRPAKCLHVNSRHGRDEKENAGSVAVPRCNFWLGNIWLAMWLLLAWNESNAITNPIGPLGLTLT